MLLFLDNDVAMKLAEYELLLAFKAIIKNSGHTIYTLASLPFVAKVITSGKNKKNPPRKEFQNQINQFIEETETASIALASTLKLITSIDDPNLDEGELTLLGCALESNDSSLCTGDKRAVLATNKLAKAKTISLEQCIIIILEHTLKIILQASKAEEVLDKVISNPEVDKAIAICFRGATTEKIDQVIYALESYIHDLQNKCTALTFLKNNDI